MICLSGSSENLNIECSKMPDNNAIQDFPAWRSAQKGKCGEKKHSFVCCALGKVFNGTLPRLRGRQVGGGASILSIAVVQSDFHQA